MREVGRIASLVALEQVKFTFGAEFAGQIAFACAAYGLPEQETAVPGKGLAVGLTDFAVKAHDTSLTGPPGQDRERGGIGEEQKIASIRGSEARKGGCVKADALAEGTRQLAGHDRDVLLYAEDIAKGETDELDIIFLDELDGLARGVVQHRKNPPDRAEK